MKTHPLSKGRMFKKTFLWMELVSMRMQSDGLFMPSGRDGGETQRWNTFRHFRRLRVHTWLYADFTTGTASLTDAFFRFRTIIYFHAIDHNTLNILNQEDFMRWVSSILSFPFRRPYFHREPFFAISSSTTCSCSVYAIVFPLFVVPFLFVMT